MKTKNDEAPIQNKQNKKWLGVTGVVLFMLSFFIKDYNIGASGSVAEFFAAAAPWILMGLGAACIAAYSSSEKSSE